MLTTSISDNNRIDAQMTQDGRGTRDEGKLLFLCLSVLLLLGGCGPREPADVVRLQAQESDRLYAAAVAGYKKLIAKSKDPAALCFELGRIYYSRGDYKNALTQLRRASDKEANKFLALAFYHQGEFSEALLAFGRQKDPDPETSYYHGLACEKLNLYDQALEIYKKIPSGEFADWADLRQQAIEKPKPGVDIAVIDPQAHQRIIQAPPAKDYPQAGALLLLCAESIEVTPDDRQISSMHYLIKILNQRGKEDFSEALIEYDSTYEKVELEYARTIKANGEVVEVGSRHIRDVSKYMNFPLYSNARVFIVSFPAVEESACIEYKVKVTRNQLINKKDLVVVYPLQTSEPLIDASFQLIVPSAKTLQIKNRNEQYNTFGANLTPQVQEQPGQRIYRWQFKNIPQIIPESDMPPASEINPTMLISTFASWTDIHTWWWGLAREKIPADELIKAEVRKLLLGKDTDEEKIRALYNFTARKIRYVAVEYGDAGYEPHKAGDILKNRYGDCKDQAILLVSMLREAGFPAYPVLIATKGSYNLVRDFPAMLFNHCIAVVETPGGLVFLDPTAETCSYNDLPAGDQDRQVLVIRDQAGEIAQTPMYPSEHNSLKESFQVRINNDESMSAKRKLSTAGIYDQSQRAWLMYTPPELVEEALKKKIQGFSIGSSLDGYTTENVEDLNNPIVLEYRFRGPEYFTTAGQLRILPQLASLDTAMVAKDKRTYPMDFTVLDSKESVYDIEAPKGFSVQYLPQNVSAENRWLSFKVEYAHNGSAISCRQKIDLKDPRVEPADYPEFREFIQGLSKKNKERVIFKKEL